METASIFIPIDRRLALAQGHDLPDRSHGAALFADISGFTQLTEALVRELGPKRGPEEVTRQLNTIYTAVIQEIEIYTGSVIGFAGDSITCWFDHDDGWRALSCALVIQQVMRHFTVLKTPSGTQIGLAIKVAVALGPVRRFLVGDPTIQLLDALAGQTLDRMAQAERSAEQGEIIASAEVIEQLGARVTIAAWRTDPADGARFAVVAGLSAPAAAQPWPAFAPNALSHEQIKPWLLAPVYELLRAGQGEFLAEFRPVVALFLKFGGIDYDADQGAATTLDNLIRWIQQILTRYGGALLQLVIGDKGSYIYSTFGAPLAHEDDPARALAAASELINPPESIQRLNTIQIGLSRGRMWAGAYGSPTCQSYSVLGDDVNLAARLMQKATPGQILVTQAIVEATGTAYHFKSMGLLELKGKSQALPVALLLGQRHATIQRPISLFPNQLVGREAELAILIEALPLIHSAQGQIVRLEGPAGLGKSHLSAEFAEQAIDQGLRLIVGTCLSTSQDVAYTPWRQIFRDVCGLAEEATNADAATLSARQIAELEGFIQALNPEWMLRLPLLGDLLQLPVPDNATTAAFDPRLRQEALVALAVDVLQAVGRQQPLLVMLEDVHWMDEASLRLTLALGRTLADEPILLMLVHRPPIRDAQPILPDLTRLAFHRQIALQELNIEGVAALVSQRLKGAPSVLALDVIQSRAQGNPFFTEELVDTLRESERLLRNAAGTWVLAQEMLDALHTAGCLRKDQGEWRLVPNAQLSGINLGIPDSVHGVVLSRLDRLPEAHKLTLKVASVIGRIFSIDVLARAHPLKPHRADLLTQISMLEDRDFARLELPAPWLAYMFKHSITQEVAYATLLDSQQRELHRIVGESLELVEPEAVEQLAYHFSRSDVLAKTLHYLELAARKTQRDYANETALEYYSAALKLADRWQWHKGQIEILHILGRRDAEQSALSALTNCTDCPPFEVNYLWGQYYDSIGDYTQAQASLEHALESARATNDLHSQARALLEFGVIATRQGNYEQASGWFMQALEAIPDSEESSPAIAHNLVEILNGLGTVYRQQGDFEAAKMCYNRALQTSRQKNNLQGEASALNNLGGTAFYQRNFVEALDDYQQALTIRHTIGDRSGEGVALYNQGMARRDMGDYGHASTDFLAALEIQQEIGDRWEESSILNGLGVLYQELGDLEKAKLYLQQGLQITEELGAESNKAYVLVNLGIVACEQGQFEQARAILNEGVTLAQTQHDKFLISAFLSYLSYVDLQVSAFESAIHQAHAAKLLRDEIDLKLLTTGDLTTLALASLGLGNLESALDYTYQALSILDGCGGEGPEVPHRDYFQCSQVLARLGKFEEAEQSLRSAQQLLAVRAERILDDKLRRSFLENIPLNQKILHSIIATSQAS